MAVSLAVGAPALAAVVMKAVHVHGVILAAVEELRVNRCLFQRENQIVAEVAAVGMIMTRMAGIYGHIVLVTMTLSFSKQNNVVCSTSTTKNQSL